MADHAFIHTSKNAMGIMEFEFKIKFFDALRSERALSESMANAVTEMLRIRPEKSEELTLSSEQIEITEIRLIPNATRPRSMKVSGVFRCKVVHKQIFEDALYAAKDRKRISNQFAERAKVKQTKVGIQQFKIQVLSLCPLCVLHIFSH